jgi:hypothetical protein
MTKPEMRQQIDLSTGKTAVHSYATCIEKYFLPYFGDKVLEEISHTDVREFELWRDRQMARNPKTSTLNNFTTAWSRVIATAVERGFISERVPVPKLTAKGVKGVKGKTRQDLASVKTKSNTCWRLWKVGSTRASSQSNEKCVPCCVTMWKCC